MPAGLTANMRRFVSFSGISKVLRKHPTERVCGMFLVPERAIYHREISEITLVVIHLHNEIHGSQLQESEFWYASCVSFVLCVVRALG